MNPSVSAGGALSTLLASTACDRSYADTLTVQAERGQLAYCADRHTSRLRRWAGRLVGARAPDLFEAQLLDMASSIRLGTLPSVTVRDGDRALRLARHCETSPTTWPEPPERVAA